MRRARLVLYALSLNKQWIKYIIKIMTQRAGYDVRLDVGCDVETRLGCGVRGARREVRGARREVQGLTRGKDAS